MEHILLAYDLPKETVMILYKDIKAMVFSPDSDIDFFDIVVSLARRYIGTIFIHK